MANRCDKCRKECKDSAAVELKGQIKFFCFECYREYKKRKGEWKS